MDTAAEATPKVIPVLGFATLSRFDLAQRLLDSIDYPVEHLVIVDNSGKKEFSPVIPSVVKNFWMLQMPFGLGANGAWNLIIKATPHAPYWVLPNDDCVFERGALQTIAEKADPQAFNFLHCEPKWSCVVPGEGAVAKAGLWDEAFYPIYFDDNDYEWRMEQLGVRFNRIPAQVRHDNSSTLQSGYQGKNAVSFSRNHALWESKKISHNTGCIGWSLKIRRENSWD